MLLRKNRNLTLSWQEEAGRFLVIREAPGGITIRHNYANPLEAYRAYSDAAGLQSDREFQAWLRAHGYHPYTGEPLNQTAKEA